MVDAAADQARYEELHRRARIYQQRYGDIGTPESIKAGSALAARERRMRWLYEERTRIDSELASLQAELGRIERWVAFCLEDAIEQAQRRHGEAWSPYPVLGYRVWAIGPDGFHGVKIPWSGPSMTATCLRAAGGDEIPHTDGRCGRLGCGIYVAKEVAPLYEEFGVRGRGDVALGLVALTGKVVEHDRGYRGARADVVALGASLENHVFLTADRGRLEEVFASPSLLKHGRIEEDADRRLVEMEMFVTGAETKEKQWISGNSSE